MKNSKMYNMFRFIAMAGNTVFVLWILRNGINEGFKGKLFRGYFLYHFVMFAGF